MEASWTDARSWSNQRHRARTASSLIAATKHPTAATAAEAKVETEVTATIAAANVEVAAA